MKVCSACKVNLPLEKFGNNKTTKDGLMRQCKRCNTERVKKHYALFGQKVDPTRVHRRHGLSAEKYEEVLSKYDGKCHGCKENPATAIDHDHNHCPGGFGCEGCVRGILCHWCNSALGFLMDSPERAEALTSYLRLWSNRQVV